MCEKHWYNVRSSLLVEVIHTILTDVNKVGEDMFSLIPLLN